MKTILEVCLYSGTCMYDPRIELSEEIRNTLLEKVQMLDGPAIPKQHHGMGLGPNMFMVTFWDYLSIVLTPDSFTTPMDLNLLPEIPHIFSTPDIITVSKKDSSWASYADNQGIHKFLEELAAPAIAEHNRDAQSLMSQFPYNPPPWEYDK